MQGTSPDTAQAYGDLMNNNPYSKIPFHKAQNGKNQLAPTKANNNYESF